MDNEPCRNELEEIGYDGGNRTNSLFFTDDVVDEPNFNRDEAIERNEAADMRKLDAVSKKREDMMKEREMLRKIEADL